MFFYYKRYHSCNITKLSFLRILLIIVMYFIPILTFAQRPPKVRCGTFESNQEVQRLQSIAEADKQFENWLRNKIQDRQQSNQNSEIIYTIPVIFHIVHESNEAPGVGRNLAKSKIDSQIVQLNRDFANQSGSQYGIAADIKIQFCPALVDTNGNILPEPGIDRIDRNMRGWNAPPYSLLNLPIFYAYGTIMPGSIWDPNKYYNVWTVESSDKYGVSSYPTGSGLPGLSPFTVALGFNNENDSHAGVFVDYPTVGSKYSMGLGGTTAGMGRTLTHETGHFLGLRHIWGDSHCGNDHCVDTPEQADETSIDRPCPDSTFTQYWTNCNGPMIKRMFENYMDYSRDECMNTYTQDQKLRMRTVMENSPRRVSLITSTVCCISADLTIVAPNVSSTSLVAGDTITAYFAEDNDGPGLAAPNYVSFHLSPDDVLTPGQNGDIYIGEYYVNQTLSPLSQTILLSKQLAIPASVAAGTYYIFFSADGTGAVNECVEDNNFATVIISISDTQTLTQASYRYWFNNQFPQAISVRAPTGNNYILQRLIPTTSLPQGLHSLNIQFKDTDSKWSSVISSHFLKSGAIPPAGSAKYEYWFDNNYNSRVIKDISSTSTLFAIDILNTEEFNTGLHVLNIRFKPDGKHWSSVASSFFFKPDSAIATGPTQYEYWFDSNTSEISVVNISSTSNLFLLNNTLTTGLVNGLHTFNIRFRPDGKNWSSIVSSLFYKDDSSNIAINNLAQFIYWYDNNWQAPKTISIVGADNLSWTLNTDVSELSEGTHKLSMSFKDIKGKWSSIVSDNFTRSPIPTQNCFFGNRKFGSGFLTGGLSSYQWQLDDGTGFTNISDNSFYSGTNSDSLNLINVPSSWYGYIYRCLVTTGGNTITGEDRILKFSMIWTGAVNTAWEDPGNWSCGVIPDANTDVYINSNMPVYPKVNSLVSCRSINLQPGTALEVMQGFRINITGRE